MKKISFKTLLCFVVSLLIVLGVVLSFQIEEVDATTVRSYGIITNGPLNIRSGPATSYASLGKLSKGTKITILASKMVNNVKWYAINYRSDKAYVCAKYVKLTGTQYFYSSSIPSTVIAEPLNVRTGPGTNYAVAGSLSALKKISVESLYKKSDGKIWYRITYNGSKRYVSAKYVALHTQDSTLSIFSSSKKATAKSKTSIYTGANTRYSVCGYKSAGNSLSLLGSIINQSDSKWYLISYENRICYIPAKNISITNVTSGTNAAKIINLALSKVNADYEYGAEGPNSFDCSGFVYWVVNNSGISGLSVPRTSSALYEKFLDSNIGTNLSNAKAADIILFSDNGKESGICHAAIYYKDGKMIHASTPSTGVIISEVSYSTVNKDIFAIIRLPGV